jgi:hypothetical protein
MEKQYIPGLTVSGDKGIRAKFCKEVLGLGSG